jgi:chromosome segregation ATPase
MKFERLQADIQNYIKEDSLSINTVFGVILDIIADVEKDTGQKVKNCDIGDEELATRIVQLCRFVQGIYDVHGSQMQEDQERLERFLGKIRDVEAKLVQAEEQLSGLKAKEKALRQEKEKFLDLLSEEEGTIERCKAENISLAADISSKKKYIGEVSGSIQKYKEQLPKLAADIKMQQEEKQKLEKELEELTDKKADADFEKEKLQELVMNFRANEVDSSLKELEQIKLQLQESKDEQTVYEEETKQLKADREALVLSIAGSTSALKLARKNYEEAADRLEQSKQEKIRIEEERTKLEEEARRITSGVDQLLEEERILEEEKIPEAQKNYEDMNNRVEELKAAHTDITEKTQSLLTLRDNLDEELAQKGNGLLELQNEYNALTAKLAEHNSEITDLHRKLNALKEETNEVQLATIKEQYQQDICWREKLSSDCKSLEVQIADVENEIERMKEQRYVLEQKKNEMDGISSKIQEDIRIFSPIADAGFDTELSNKRGQLRMMNEIQKRLEKDISRLHQSMGSSSIAELSLSDQIQFVLQEMDGLIKEMESDLRNCAKTVKIL